MLATSIAETSLTIEGVRIVIDSGQARRSRFNPGSGMSRLETLPVSLAAAEQRGLTGAPSGLRDLDKITSGFQKSNLIILAARPAMGKTSLALGIARGDEPPSGT